jgi:hypothetical protein
MTMAAGLSAVNLANAWLNTLSGTTFTGVSTFVKLHTGDPGASGAANASANTTRVALSWSAASAGSKAITATLPSWATWAAGSETLSYISVWDNLTAGNFLFSAQLTIARSVVNGDTVNLTSLTFALTPIAA